MSTVSFLESARFRDLREEVSDALREFDQARNDAHPTLEKELAVIEDQQSGWKQSLANKDLHPRIRDDLTAAWTTSIEREEEIRAILSEQEGHRNLRELILDAKAIQSRLDRLDQILADNVATLANIELSLHIDHIECFRDGRVVMRTCKLGLLGDICDLFAEPSLAAPHAGKAANEVKPRRRSRRSTAQAPENRGITQSVAFAATDCERFAGLPDKWFWVDTFQLPGRVPAWPVLHAEKVFVWRQKHKASYAKLGEKFRISAPTARAAVQEYLRTHPEARDEVHLIAGGKRPKKFNLAIIGPEAKRLFDQGVSKLRLAEQFNCSTPTIDKAIEFACEQQSVPVPTRASRTTDKVNQARCLLDNGASLQGISAELGVTDVTVRGYLHASFKAEGKPMPDLRRSRKLVACVNSES